MGGTNISLSKQADKRKKGRQIDTNGQTDGQTDGETDEETQRMKGRKPEGQKDRKTYDCMSKQEQTDKQTDG